MSHTSHESSQMTCCHSPAATAPQHDGLLPEPLSYYLKQYRWLIATLAGVFVFAVVMTIVNGLEMHVFMQYLMAGYFLAFGILQTLALTRAAAMLRQYDPLARKVKLYSYAYPLIQLGFGVAYLLWLSPIIVNLLAMLFVGINTLGVIEVLVQKKKVWCGCLGSALNAPVSFVTLAENVFMLLMATSMFIYFFVNFIPYDAEAGDTPNRTGHFHRSI